jgi:hypothetical protein
LFAFVFSCVVTCSAVLAVGSDTATRSQDNLLDDATLDRLLVKELTATLQGGASLTPLPRNVQSVVIGPQGEPCFVVPAVDAYRQTRLATTVARIARHEPGFRVIWEASVIGHDGDRAMLVAAGDDSASPPATVTVAVASVDADSTRHMTIPKMAGIRQAIRSGDRWIFLTNSGMIGTGDDAAWPGSDVFGRGMPLRMFPMGAGGVVIYSVTYEQNQSPQCRIGTSDGTSWSIQTIPVTPRESPRVILRRNDGRWLGVSQRIVELDPKRPAKPPEADLQAAIDAARSGDWPTFLEKLELVSHYPSEDLAGLITLLSALPDRGAKLRMFRGQLEQMQRTLATMPVPEELDASQAERITESLSLASKQIEASAAAITTVAPELLVQSPRAVIEHLRNGMQRYRGQWLQVVDVLHQGSIDSALLVIAKIDETTGSTKNAIVRFEADGSLRLVCDLPERWGMSREGWYTDAAGNSYGVIPNRGLVRIGSQGIEPIDTPDRLKGLVKVVAVDGKGRIYVQEALHRAGPTGALRNDLVWVYSAPSRSSKTNETIGTETRGASGDAVGVNIWPIVGQPAAAPDGTVWFVRRVPGESNDRVPPRAPMLTDTSGITTTTITLEDEGSAPAAGPIIGQPDRGLLCRLKSPTNITEYTSLAVLGQNTLGAGRSGAWIEGLQGTDKGRLIFVDSEKVRRESDLHVMARRHFEALLEAAPSSALPEGWAGFDSARGVPAPSQMLRMGDLLWINAAGRVEAYDKGKPLSVHDRLILRTGKVDQPRLIGPIDRGDGTKSIVVLTAPQQIERFAWITPTDKGLTIEWADKPSADWQGGLLDAPGRFLGLPLAVGSRSWLAACNGMDRVWQIRAPTHFVPMPDAGYPLLAVPDTDSFLAWRADRVRSGVRICSPTSRRDVPVTFTTRLEPVTFQQDGSLLCLRPDGLAWLKPDVNDGYSLDSTVLLPHGLTPLTFVGFVGKTIVITAATPRWDTCLVTVRPGKQQP